MCIFRPLTTSIDNILVEKNGAQVVGTGTTFTPNDTINGNGKIDVKLNINDTTGASAAGVPAGVTVKDVQFMTVNSNASVGSAGTSAVAGVAEILTVTPVVAGSTTVTGASIVVAGQTYSTGTISVTTAANLRTEIKNLFVKAFGGAVTLDDDSGSAAFTATVKATGTLLPTISYGVTTSAGTSSISDSVTRAPVNAIAATGLSEVQTIVLGGTAAAADVYTVQVGGRSVVAYTGDAQATAATQIAAQINALYGSAIATAVGKTVTVQGAVGVALPAISATASQSATATTAIVSSAAAATATAAVYDVSGFTGLNTFTTTSFGGDNVKVAGTTDAIITNANGGGVTLEGGKVVNITTSGTTSAVSVTGKALTTVNVTGGTGTTVNNQENTTAATSNAGTTLTTASLTKVDGNSTLGGKGLVNVTIAGATTDARTVTITNSTVNHAQNLTLVDTGYKADGTTEVQTVITDAAASSLNVVSSGAKNSVNLSNNTLTNTVTISGAGNLKANVAVASLNTINGAAATGNLDLGTLHANTINVTTGSGADKLQIAATTATTVATNAGNDTVTLGSALAAGSSVSLGDGNDVLKSASGSVASGASSTTGRTTTIDGGAGTDTLVASLVNNGNKAIFSNFEVLGLDLTSGTFDSTLVSGITGLELLSAGGGTYTGLTTSQALTVTNTATNSVTTTLTMTGVSGTADSYAITFNAAAQTTAPTEANVLAATIAVAGIENFSIASNGGANTWNSITLGADTSAQTVVVTGTQNLDLAFASGFGSVTSPQTGVSSINASALTGKLSVNLANVVPNATALQVTGGSAADTFITTTAKATLTLGAGSDLVNAASSIVTVSGSSATLTEATGSLATVTDIAAGDTIKLASSATAATLGTAVSTASASNLLDALNAIANDSAQTAWGVYNGVTYVLYDASASTTAGVSSNDVIVALTGTVNLATSYVNTSGVVTIA